jgi:glucose/mannose transport system substrate-binding protein
MALLETFGTGEDVVRHTNTNRGLRVAMAVALFVAACGGTPATPSAGPSGPAGQPTSAPGAGSCQYDKDRKPIEVASWWTTGGDAIGLTKLLDTFNAVNPVTCAYNVTVPGATGTVAQGRVKAAVLAGLPPDTFQVPIGRELIDTYVNAKTGSVLSPLDGIVDPEKFPAGLIDIVSGSDGKIYSVPLNVQRANLLWFNKSVLEVNGLSAPTTWEEFKTAAQKLKAAGIVPIAVGDKDIGASGLIFEAILIGELGPDRFKGLWTGTTRWDDAGVKSALDTYTMVLGYQNPDHGSLTWEQADQLVIDAKAAMTITGDWVNADFIAKNFSGYGWAAPPGNSGVFQALADSFPLPTKAQHRDAATNLLTFMASAEGQDTFNPYKGSIPARLDGGHPPADGLQYNDYQKSAMKEWTAADTVIVPSMERGAAAGAAWVAAINHALTDFVAGGSAKAALTALADAARKFAPAR